MKVTTNNSVDLHTHSYCSDGTFSPEGLVILAKRTGLRAIALTDHDTTEGIEAFQEAGRKHNIEAIAGIELAARCQLFHQPELHIVGLRIQPDAPALVEMMAEIYQSRIMRNKKMVQNLCDIGLSLTLADIEQCAGGEIITRAHFARALMQKGYIATMGDAFQKYISPGMAGYEERELFSTEACIAGIHQADGVAILAHPTLYDLSYDQLDTLCGDLKAKGLDGIECYYSTFTPAQRKNMLRLAKKFDLLPSGGSDFHGENKPNIRLGTGKNNGNLPIPYEIWEAIKNHEKE